MSLPAGKSNLKSIPSGGCKDGTERTRNTTSFVSQGRIFGTYSQHLYKTLQIEPLSLRDVLPVDAHQVSTSNSAVACYVGVAVMNWEAIGAIAELLAAIGVIVALIYLAFQVCRNTHKLPIFP